LYCVCCIVICCVTLRFEHQVYKSQSIELMISVNIDEENIVAFWVVGKEKWEGIEL